MGASQNKLLIELAGRSIISWTLEAAEKSKLIKWIGIIGQPVDKKKIMSFSENLSKPVRWINGGSTRQESVQLGLASLPDDAENVMVHDGARCMIEASFFDKCASAIERGNSVIAATPVTDTIKRVNEKMQIVETPDRSHLWSAQTPQCFKVKELKQAHKVAIEKGWNVTDDASLYERLGWKISIIESNPSNIKVTTKFDLKIAEVIFKSHS